MDKRQNLDLNINTDDLLNVSRTFMLEYAFRQFDKGLDDIAEFTGISKVEIIKTMLKNAEKQEK